MTAEAWAVSTDGGQHWNGGMTVDGDVIARILNATGINADWINTGTIKAIDKDGNTTFLVDVTTGRVIINADSVQIKGKDVNAIAKEKAETEVNNFISNTYTTDIIICSLKSMDRLRLFFMIMNQPYRISRLLDGLQTKNERNMRVTCFTGNPRDMLTVLCKMGQHGSGNWYKIPISR